MNGPSALPLLFLIYACRQNPLWIRSPALDSRVVENTEDTSSEGMMRNLWNRGKFDLNSDECEYCVQTPHLA